MKHINDFIKYAEDRHAIYLRRKEGLPRPWTEDPIFLKYRFTNVFRELDKTTVWYRENVREKYDGTFSVFLATVLFRWFNRIQTGEALFSQINFPLTPEEIAGHPYLTEKYKDECLRAEPVAADYLAGRVGTAALRRAIVAFCGRGPYVTGAYIITSPAGLSKLDGVLACVEAIRAREHIWEKYFLSPRTLERAWAALCQEMHMGPFMAYEVITDLRHTHLLRNAPDIHTWANPGPGAQRGIMRVMGHAVESRSERIVYSRAQCIAIMRDVMDLVNYSDLTYNAFWPKWEMRDVEHTLCEYDKYMRVKTGLGRPRGTFS